MNTRTLFSTFLAVLMLLLITSNDSAAVKPKRIRSRVPSQIEHDMGVIDLDSLRGQNVSVTFWSSDDAASRLENVKLAMEARANPGRKHIGINIDDAPAIYRAYLLRDRLHQDSLQFRAKGEEIRDMVDTFGYHTVYY